MTDWGWRAVFFLPSFATPAITLFSQPTERAGTHAGVWKQEFPPRRKGGVGGIPPTFARTRATDSSHTSHRLPGAGSPPAGENDGVGGFVSSAASMTCCVFFAVIYDAGDYPILSAYRACRDARRRVETGVSPIRKGGGGHPYSLAYFPLCFVVVRRSLGHALNVRSLLRAFHASPTEKYTALTHIRAYTRNRFFAYQPQVARRR